MKKLASCLFCSVLFAAAHAQGPRLTVQSARPLPFLSDHNGQSCQSAEVTLDNPGDSTTVTIKVKGLPDQQLPLAHGAHSLEIFLPEVKKPTTTPFSIQGATGKVDLTPVRKMTIYILPHSHNDIGYTEIQTNVERKQMNNLLTGIDYARRTKDYPAGARFVWNLEGVYAADLFLHRMNEQQKQDFIAAVKDGGVALNGMYVNTLTGL